VAMFDILPKEKKETESPKIWKENKIQFIFAKGK
jgi:hypothetical protein